MSVQIGNIDLGEFPLLLAPMEDVSDPPFRYVCKQNGADMMYTEFISSEGLIRDAAKSRQKLDIFEYERPIGIQIFGSDIDHMREATEIASLAGPGGNPASGAAGGRAVPQLRAATRAASALAWLYEVRPAFGPDQNMPSW